MSARASPHPLLLAGGEHLGIEEGVVGQHAHHAQGLDHLLPALLLAQGRVEAGGLQDLADGFFRLGRCWGLEDHPQQLAAGLVIAVDHGLPLDGDLPAARFNHARQNAGQGALPEPASPTMARVWPTSRSNGGLYRRLHRAAPEQAGAVLVGLAQAPDLQQGRFGHDVVSLGALAG